MAASFAAGTLTGPAPAVAKAEESVWAESARVGIDYFNEYGEFSEPDVEPNPCPPVASDGESESIYEIYEDAKNEVNAYWEAKIAPWIGGLTITGAAYLAIQAITWIIGKSRKMKRDAKVDENISVAADSNAKAVAALEGANKALASVSSMLDKVEATSDDTRKALEEMKSYVDGTRAAIAAIKASADEMPKLKSELKCLCAMLSEYISSDDEAVRSGVAKKAAEISKAVEGM